MKVRLLLRRFAFGDHDQAYARVLGLGASEVMDTLLAAEEGPEAWPADALLRSMNRTQKTANMRQVQLAEAARIICFDAPLRAHMILFWHDHFAVSASKVASPPVMEAHFGLLRQNALGSFGAILNAVSKDQAMLFWLDQQENKKGKPNENWARELLELFTLGIGRYSESDVKECARAFTGWTFGQKRASGASPLKSPRPGAEFVLHLPDHDAGEKSILGEQLRTGQQVLDLVSNHPASAEHLVSKLWAWFASAEPPPSGVLQRLAGRFRASGMQIKEVLRGMMEEPEFYAAAQRGQHVKNPLYIVRQMAEATGMDAAQRRRLLSSPPRTGNAAVSAPGALFLSARAMGMELMRPPDVAGWAGGEAWISTNLMVERIRLGEQWASGPPGGLISKDPEALKAWPRSRSELAIWLITQCGLTPTESRVAAVEQALGKDAKIADRQLTARAGRALSILFADPEFHTF